jgi:hypothetical protein
VQNMSVERSMEKVPNLQHVKARLAQLTTVRIVARKAVNAVNSHGKMRGNIIVNSTPMSINSIPQNPDILREVGYPYIHIDPEFSPRGGVG